MGALLPRSHARTSIRTLNLAIFTMIGSRKAIRRFTGRKRCCEMASDAVLAPSEAQDRRRASRDARASQGEEHRSTKPFRVVVRAVPRRATEASSCSALRDGIVTGSLCNFQLDVFPPSQRFSQCSERPHPTDWLLMSNVCCSSHPLVLFREAKACRVNSECEHDSLLL
jgi:hypothetical protein